MWNEVLRVLGSPLSLSRDQLVQLIAGTLVFGVCWLAAMAVRAVTRRWMSRRSLRTDIALVTERLVFGGLIALGLLLFVTISIGQALVGVAGFVTAALVTSLGLQDLFKNYVSGFYVLLERNVRVGDRIETEGFQGVVTEVRMRVTYLRGDAGQLIVVPNTDLFSKPLVVSAPEPSAGEGTQHDADQGLEVVRRQV